MLNEGWSGLSGEALASVGRPLLLEIGARGRKRKQHADGSLGAAVPRGAQGRLQAAGDVWWVVDRVVEVRRRGGRTRAQAQAVEEARIRWRGRNPQTGLPWPDVWREVMARDWRGRLLLNAPTRAEAKAMIEVKYGAKPKKRARGEASDEAAGGGASVQASRPKAAKWRRVLRGAAVGGCSWPKRRRARQIDVSSDEEDDGDEVEIALADVRRRRHQAARRAEQTDSLLRHGYHVAAGGGIVAGAGGGERGMREERGSGSDTGLRCARGQNM